MGPVGPIDRFYDDQACKQITPAIIFLYEFTVWNLKGIECKW